jgi:hypothetical protein
MDDLRHVRCQVVHLPVTTGFQQDLFLINHALFLRATAWERKSDGGSLRTTNYQPRGLRQ